MAWTNKQTSKQKASGAVNPVRVTCGKCRQASFIKPRPGGWKCGHCGHNNRG